MQKQVLIIEDQESTRKLLNHFLSNSFKVVEKESATDAILWLKDGNVPDAIVSDIIFPKMTGVEFLKELKENSYCQSPVLMLSSIENSSEKMKCLQLGAKDYLVKPFNPEELLLRIENLIKN